MSDSFNVRFDFCQYFTQYSHLKDPSKRQWVKDAVEQYVLETYVGNAAQQNVFNDQRITDLIDELSNKKLSVEEVDQLRTLLINSKFLF